MSERQAIGTRAYLAKLVNDVRASYWFLPACMVGLAVLLAVGTRWLDNNTEALPEFLRLPDTYLVTRADGARSTLAVIAQSILGVGGVMFSMTLVAVSFASGNFGPRLITNFMRDRGNQISLGILIATFVYAVLILRAVDAPEEGGGGFIPQYSMMLALGLAFVSILTVIYFIHHIPETINVSNICAGLGHRFAARIRAHIDAQEDDAEDWPTERPDERIALPTAGYIQTQNIVGLRAVAEDADLHVGLGAQPGDFVHPNLNFIAIWGSPDDGARRRIRACFAVGDEPTEEQNVRFIANQLVEMIARALSPGINDPYTAINCLNWLHRGLTEAIEYGGGLRTTTAGRVRRPRMSYRDLHKASLTSALPYVASDPLAQTRMAWLLRDLARRATGADRDFILSERRRLLRHATLRGARAQGPEPQRANDV